MENNKHSNRMAIASLICSIIGIICLIISLTVDMSPILIFMLILLFSTLGIVLGIINIKSKKQNKSQPLDKAGLILGIICFVITIIIICFYLISTYFFINRFVTETKGIFYN